MTNPNDPSIIYLEPYPGSPDGRMWCEDPVWDEIPEGSGVSVPYVRASVLRDLLKYRPYFRDYTGTDWDTCAFCREPVEAAEHRHRPDCPWERLRTLLSTTKDDPDA